MGGVDRSGQTGVGLPVCVTEERREDGKQGAKCTRRRDLLVDAGPLTGGAVPFVQDEREGHTDNAEAMAASVGDEKDVVVGQGWKDGKGDERKETGRGSLVDGHCPGQSSAMMNDAASCGDEDECEPAKMKRLRSTNAKTEQTRCGLSSRNRQAALN